MRQGADDARADLQPAPRHAPDEAGVRREGRSVLAQFARVTWDEALDGIARKLLEIRDASVPEAVASKTTGRMARGAGSIIGRFFELYGSPNATDVGPVCNDAGGNALATSFGLGNFSNGYGVDGATGREDLGASRYLLMFGTNQAETHPVTFEYLLRARAATGAKLVVVDPRRTPTGALADRHVAIRPHTDMALACGMLATIIDEGLHDAAFVERSAQAARRVRGRQSAARQRQHRAYILPVTSVLEMDCVYMRRDDRAIRWCNQAVPPVGEARSDIEIWLGLAAKMAQHDRRHPPTYWTNNLRAEWKDYRVLWDEVFVKRTAGMAGMTSERLKSRAEPLRWPCPSPDHPGVSTLYLDHPSWQQAAAALGHPGKRFLTPSGKIEITTPALNAKLAVAGHAALPPFYAHPETTGDLATVTHSQELVENPINPGTLTPKATLGVPARRPAGSRWSGMIGRPSVAHFASVTHWIASAKQLNGIRLVQIHPRTASAAGIANGDTVRVESPRGAVTGTALLFDGIREDTIFVPNTFGPAQRVAEENGLPLYEPANLLVDDRHFDNLSGQQAYKCFACKIVKA